MPGIANVKDEEAVEHFGRLDTLYEDQIDGAYVVEHLHRVLKYRLPSYRFRDAVEFSVNDHGIICIWIKLIDLPRFQNVAWDIGGHWESPEDAPYMERRYGTRGSSGLIRVFVTDVDDPKQVESVESTISPGRQNLPTT